eukprot:TRINITY_DN12764_c0_g1_i2.p1 TRINITY_DN12764_c0_g1~~TRINITY_DN12764_c0_g1_i2.p1  ORF type:complete len:146 (-),score=22.48 TRINITY_DN12764_c0_g1_i2:172-549(-)
MCIRDSRKRFEKIAHYLYLYERKIWHQNNCLIYKINHKAPLTLYGTSIGLFVGFETSVELLVEIARQYINAHHPYWSAAKALTLSGFFGVNFLSRDARVLGLCVLGGMSMYLYSSTIKSICMEYL